MPCPVAGPYNDDVWGSMKAGPSQEEIRRHNLGTLLRHVHIGGSMSRAVLAERMGLNRSTILGLVSELGSAGLVREELPRETGRAGRPSLVVRPESDRVYVLAFDVGVDRLAAARIGLGGVFLDRREISVLPGRRNAGKVAEVLAGSALEMMSTAPHGTYCVGVAAAVRGMVRRPDGLVRAVPYLGWEDEEFGQDLTRQLGLGLPVSVGNEASLGALAEHLRGAGTGCQDLVYLHGDIGIGGGVITGGQLLSGDRGYGGEIGHMVVNPRNGRPCGCGARGCLEAEAGSAPCWRPRSATRRPPAGKPYAPSSKRPTGATSPPAPPCTTSATGSASASPTWSMCSTHARSSLAERSARCSSAQPLRSAAVSIASPSHPPARTCGCEWANSATTRCSSGPPNSPSPRSSSALWRRWLAPVHNQYSQVIDR